MKMDQYTVRLIHENGHIVAVSQIHDFLQIGAYPEVCRVNDQYGFGVRVTF